MSEIIELSEKRADEAGDASLWKPVHCAKAFLRDIENGSINPTSCAIVYWDEQTHQTYYRYYVSSPSTAETLYLLEVAKSDILMRGRSDG